MKRDSRRKERRKRNLSATRSALLRAAQETFVAKGYDSVGIREIAAEAGVDSALISSYFQGKEQLFRMVFAQSHRPEDLYRGTPEEFAERMTEIVVGEGFVRRELDGLMMILRSVSSPQAVKAIKEMSRKNYYEPIAGWLGGDDNWVRAKMLAAIIMGLGANRAISDDFQLGARDRQYMRERVKEIILALVKTVPDPRSNAKG